MKKTIKIILTLGLAITMLFAVVGLSGCGATVLDCICDESCNGECNFELVIDVENTTLLQREDVLIVSIRLYNKSGQDIRIGYQPMSVFSGWIYDYYLGPPLYRPQRRIIRTMRNNEYFYNVQEISIDNLVLPIGIHCLSYRATFLIGYGVFSERFVWVWSNVIQIAIIEGEQTNV